MEEDGCRARWIFVAQTERNWLGRPSARRRPEEEEGPVNPEIDRDEEKN